MIKKSTIGKVLTGVTNNFIKEALRRGDHSTVLGQAFERKRLFLRVAAGYCVSNNIDRMTS